MEKPVRMSRLLEAMLVGRTFMEHNGTKHREYTIMPVNEGIDAYVSAGRSNSFSGGISVHYHDQPDDSRNESVSLDKCLKDILIVKEYPVDNTPVDMTPLLEPDGPWRHEDDGPQIHPDGPGHPRAEPPIQDMFESEPLCECGSRMIRNGACYKCTNCGNTLGCS